MKLFGVEICGTEKNCAVMDLPPSMCDSCYDFVGTRIKNSVKVVYDIVVTKAAKEEMEEIS